MKPLLLDVNSLLKNSIHVKEIRTRRLSDQLHFHNVFEIALIVKGNGRRIVGDNVDNFSDGDLTILAPNLPHVAYSDKKYHVKETSAMMHAVVIYFQPDWIAEYHLNSPEFAPIRLLLKQLSRGIKVYGNARSQIAALLMKIREADGLKAFIMLLEILYIVVRSKDYSYLASQGYSSTYNEHSIRRIHEVYKYVMENFTDRIYLEDVASLSCMTPSAFCKYFRSKTKKTFTNFVNEVRIQYACGLLRDENLDISDICFKSGFNNFSSFNKNFKHYIHSTPSAYRRKFSFANMAD